MRFLKDVLNVLFSKNFRNNYSSELSVNCAKEEIENEKIYSAQKR